MARPVVSDVAEELYATLVPFNETAQGMDGEATSWGLLKYTAAIASMIDPVAGYVRDTADGKPGWSTLLDLSRIPSEALDWAAQFIGVTTIPGTSDAAKRARIASTDGFNRGTAASIAGAAKATLTGTQFVKVVERYDWTTPTLDAPYNLYVATLPAETPSQAATLAAIMAQKPAGMNLRYVVTSGTSSYEGLAVYYADYAAVASTFATYGAIQGMGTYQQVGEKYATYTASDGHGTYSAPT